MEANGLSKLAQRMQSGPWQGFAGGAGIGGAVSLGLGTVVGTLVGGVLSVPMVGLGALVGTGVGAVHGPFIKIGGKEKSLDEANAEDVVDALEQEQNGKTTDGERYYVPLKLALTKRRRVLNRKGRVHRGMIAHCQQEKNQSKSQTMGTLLMHLRRLWSESDPGNSRDAPARDVRYSHSQDSSREHIA
jgi:hypothetical protein